MEPEAAVGGQCGGRGRTGRPEGPRAAPGGSASTRDLAASAPCPRHDPADAPALGARRAGPGIGRSGRCLRHRPFPGETVLFVATPAGEAAAAPRGQPPVAVPAEPLPAGAPGAAEPAAADPGAAAGRGHDDLRAGPASGQPGAAHQGREGAGPGHLHRLLGPGPGPGPAPGRARGDLRGGPGAPGAGAAPVAQGRRGAQDGPAAEARPGDPGRAPGRGRSRHLRHRRGGRRQGELRPLLRAVPAAAAPGRRPGRPRGAVAGRSAATPTARLGNPVRPKPQRAHPARRPGAHQPPAPGRRPHLGLQNLRWRGPGNPGHRLLNLSIKWVRDTTSELPLKWGRQGRPNTDGFWSKRQPPGEKRTGPGSRPSHGSRPLPGGWAERSFNRPAHTQLDRGPRSSGAPLLPGSGLDAGYSRLGLPDVFLGRIPE